MTVIRVVAKKCGIGGYNLFNAQAPKYLYELNQQAIKHRGYISSNSYWEFNDKLQHNSIGNIYTISDWESLSDWESWKSSNERKNIQNKFSPIIEKEQFNLLYLNKTVDTFLL